MRKLYDKIARRGDLQAGCVHLIHYVVAAMPQSYVPSPSADRTTGSAYSANDVCMAVFAYLRAHHPANPIETLRDFGIESSQDIGRVITALAKEKKIKLPKETTKGFKGLFSASEIPEELQHARWFEAKLEDRDAGKEWTQPLLKKHFGEHLLDALIVTKRLFPFHVIPDLQLALDEALGNRDLVRLVGLNQAHNFEGLSFSALLNTEEHTAVSVGPLTYHDTDIGAGGTVACLDAGLWLGLQEGSREPYAAVLGASAGYSPNPQKSVEIAVPNSPAGKKFSEQFIAKLEKSIEQSRCYRGKILSFEQSSNYRGAAAGIKVHSLAQVNRNEVILSPRTFDLLERNIINFIEMRPLLAKRGMTLKKGLLFYGPPGTGKTHTLHFLANALKDHTILLISAEQVGLLGEYMTLARLLQPSMVVIEDADLIARDRGKMGVCEEVLLNKLLNEMDGLRPDSEILFVLTTNRPEALEEALAARPGRIDQAIEFPHPDAESRERLVRLYTGTQELPAEVIERVVRNTEKTSGAFIKELMRRATQYAVTRDETSAVSLEDVNLVIEEMLSSGGILNRVILGGGDHTSETD